MTNSCEIDYIWHPKATKSQTFHVHIVKKLFFLQLQVEESDNRKDTPRQRTLSSSTEVTEEQLHATVTRVLQCTFKEPPSEKYLHLPQTAESFKRNPALSIPDLVSQSLIEVLFEISNGSNPFASLLQSTRDTCDASSPSSFSASPTQNLSPSPSPANPCPVPAPSSKFVDGDSAQNLALNYLMDCYSRVSVEERNHPKRSSIPPLSDLLTDLRAQTVHYATLVLQGYIYPSGISSVSHLVSPVLQQTLPRGFVSELVTRTHTNPSIFAKIFSPLLQGLFLSMQNASVVSNEHRQPLQALNELAEIRCGTRPLCTLITQQKQFMPNTCTQANGREITRTSFMGPFLSVSVFAEDEPKVAEKFFSGNATSDKILNHTLQQELENSRVLLYKIFHDILANTGSRDAMLEYIARLLVLNEKRSQLQVEERSLAGDGFMLNLLSVLQMLSVRVKLDKVDFLYPFHPSSIVDIKNDTRLRFASQETSEWLEELSE